MSARARIVLAIAGLLTGLGLVAAAIALAANATGAGTLFRQIDQLPLPAEASDLVARYPQLAALLKDPKLARVLKDLAVAYHDGGSNAAKTLARERGFMNANDDVTLTILIDAAGPAERAALIADITAQGAQVIGEDQAFLDVVIPWATIEAGAAAGKTLDKVFSGISRLSNVRAIQPARRTTTQLEDVGSPDATRTSEGVAVTHAADWHRAGLTGKGIKVGILDPEVTAASRFIGKALPAGTKVNTNGCVSSSGRPIDDDAIHGVAATEIVHEMAPDAELYIACGRTNVAAQIRWLTDNGVHIISHSAGGFYGPLDGTGAMEQRIDALARGGVLWVNSAGNQARVLHAGTLRGGAEKAWHEFAARDKTLDVVAGGGAIQVVLNWAEWHSTTLSDYDLYVFDGDGKTMLGASEDDNTTTRESVEVVVVRTKPGATYHVGVLGQTGAKPADFIVNVYGARQIQYATPARSVASPAVAAGSLTVGAVDWETDVLADYSSQGPTLDGRQKPEISAPTEVSSEVYGSVHDITFGGTSASAPHVAGAAALVWAANPSWSRDDVVRFLLSRARDLGPPGVDNAYGAGRLDLGAPPGEARAPTAVPTGSPIPPTVVAAVPRATTAPIAPTPSSVPSPTPSPGVTPTRTRPASGGASSNAPDSGAVILAGGIGLAGGVLITLAVVALVVAARQSGPAPVPALAAPMIPAPRVRQMGQPNQVCRRCGATLRPHARFCGKCGTRVK